MMRNRDRPIASTFVPRPMTVAREWREPDWRGKRIRAWTVAGLAAMLSGSLAFMAWNSHPLDGFALLGTYWSTPPATSVNVLPSAPRYVPPMEPSHWQQYRGGIRNEAGFTEQPGCQKRTDGRYQQQGYDGCAK